jgi:diacylglycerol O-acyltransferase / wax synthase
MTAERLSPLDASFLEIEQADDASHMHVGWAMIFDRAPSGPVDLRAVRRLAAERLGAMPRFMERLSSPRTGTLSWPTWEDDPLFDFGNHVRHAQLPDPGGEDELLEWLADFYSHRLDRAHPLWELWLVDGLVDGRWALAFKAHHCLVDGASGSVVTALLLDASADGDRALAAPPEDLSAAAGSGMAAGLVRAGQAGFGALLHPRRLLGMVDRSRALLDLAVSELEPAPETSLNVAIGASRRLAAVDARLDDMKAIKAALGGTVNDVALAATAGGLRDLLLSRDEALPDHGIRVMVPVDVRASSEMLSLGNRVSSLFVDLPVAEPDPLERYRATVAAAEALKAGRQAAGTETLLGLAALAPPVVHAFVARLTFAPRLFNVTVTNVRGSPVTLHAFGAPMRRIIPLVPIFSRHAVGVAVVSYDGRVTFGVNADRAAVPDLGTLATGIESSLEDLRLLARRAGPAYVEAAAR